MKTRTLLMVCLLMGSTHPLTSQTFPTNQLIHENISLINPSNYGYSKQTTVGLNYQKYWSKISNSPENISLLMETSLKNNKYGLGLNITKNTLSFLSRTAAGIGYRQSLKINTNSYVNFGIQLGIEKNQIDFDRISAQNPEEISSFLGVMSGTIGKGSVGLQYRFKSLQIGIASQLFFGKTFEFENPELQNQLKFRKVPYYTFFFRHPIKLKNNWVYTPSLIIMSSQGLPFNIDNLHTFSYNNLIDCGIGFRQNMNIYAHVGYEFFKQVKISYAYQRNISSYSNIFSNTHEIGLKVYLNRPKYNEENSWKKSTVSSDILNQIDQQELRTLELKGRIDSLEKALRLQKKQIEVIKQEQIEREEINQHFNHSNELENKKIDKNYEVVTIQNEADLKRLDTEINNIYYITLGAFRSAENAKHLKKLLKKELNYETAIQLVDIEGRKMYFLTLSTSFTSIRTASQKLSNFRKSNKEEYSEYLNGEPWLLKMKK